ncbi:MAG: hypothetical protein VX278_02635, partial [Myxococcota bacterium]|nr:hypothetical protein [Myxococcota bacterium]
ADEMLIEAENETDVQNDAHRLVFQYDGYGHLTQRNLYQNEIHIHQSDWTYDQYGTLAGHSVQMAMPDTEEGVLTTLSRLRQSYEEIASGSERLREAYNEGEWFVVDTYAWGEHPRGRFERQNDHFQVYDTEEELVIWGNGDWESPTYYQAWTSDEQSLLDTLESKDGSGEQTLLYTHNCAE